MEFCFFLGGVLSLRKTGEQKRAVKRLEWMKKLNKKNNNIIHMHSCP